MSLERFPENCDLTEIFTKNEGLKKLENLSLSYIYSQKEVEFHLPNLRNIIQFEDCGKLMIRAGKYLTKFRTSISRANVKSVKFIFHQTPSLREIRFKWWDHGHEGPSFFSWLNEKGILQRIRKVSFEDIHWNSNGFYFSPLENLEELNLISCQFRKSTNHVDEQSTLSQDYPNLKTFEFGPHDKFPSLSFYPFFSNLRRLSLRDLKNPETEKIFRNHQFQNLEFLHFYQMRNITGEQWNPMPKLKNIKLFRSFQFSNSPFEGEKAANVNFPSLERLEFVECPLITGLNWVTEFTNKIKYFKIYGMNMKPSFHLSTFSKKNSWLSLEDVNLHAHYGKATFHFLDEKSNLQLLALGNGKLKRLRVYGLQDLDPILFCNKQIVENLEEIWMFVCGTKGIGWEFMRNLKEVEIENCNSLDWDAFLMNPPFGEDTRLKIERCEIKLGNLPLRASVEKEEKEG